MRGNWLLGGALSALLAVAGTAGLLVWRGRKPAVSTLPVTHHSPPPPPELSLSGKIQARHVVNVPVPVAGTIDRFLADVGDNVAEGQTLAHVRNSRLESAEEQAKADAERARTRVTDLEAELIAARLEASRARSEATHARAEYERAEKIWLRQKMLVGEGATPRLVFEKAQKDFEIAKADFEGRDQIARNAESRLESAARDLEAARTLSSNKDEEFENTRQEAAAGDVHAPVNGTVVGRRGQAGDAVDPGMTDLFQIAPDLAALEVVAEGAAADLLRVRPGQSAWVQVAEAPAAIPAAVREVKNGHAYVEFSSPTPAVRPGLSAQVKIKTS